VVVDLFEVDAADHRPLVRQSSEAVDDPLDVRERRQDSSGEHEHLAPAVEEVPLPVPEVELPHGDATVSSLGHAECPGQLDAVPAVLGTDHGRVRERVGDGPERGPPPTAEVEDRRRLPLDPSQRVGDREPLQSEERRRVREEEVVPDRDRSRILASLRVDTADERLRGAVPGTELPEEVRVDVVVGPGVRVGVGIGWRVAYRIEEIPRPRRVLREVVECERPHRRSPPDVSDRVCRRYEPSTGESCIATTRRGGRTGTDRYGRPGRQVHKAFRWAVYVALALAPHSRGVA
jgi:hypothetical protein